MKMHASFKFHLERHAVQTSHSLSSKTCWSQLKIMAPYNRRFQSTHLPSDHLFTESVYDHKLTWLVNIQVMFAWVHILA